MIMLMLLLALALLVLAAGGLFLRRRASLIKWALVRNFSAALRRTVVVSDRLTSHYLLVRAGAAGARAVLCNRPPSSAASSVLSRQRYHNIASAPYSPLWRTLRRNLVAELFHPSRLRYYGAARRQALGALAADLRQQCTSNANGVVHAAESMHAAMFGLLASMCFGDGVEAECVRAMADAMEDFVRCLVSLRFFAAFPALAEIIHRKRWKKFAELRQQQEEMYIPLINVRRSRIRRSGQVPSYVDTLLDLRVPKDSTTTSDADARKRRRKLTDGELVGLCSEFLGAGTEPATAALQWTMANLVKHPDVQDAVRREINAVVDAEAEEVGEEVLGGLEYLNAVVMEALRLYPPVPSVIRQVMPEDDIDLDGKRVPAGSTVMFLLKRVARDKTAWAKPNEFLPERFMSSSDEHEGGGLSFVEAAGSGGEIKMMPFGAGRRMCPGMGVALLHLSYLVANLVREFQWCDGHGDLAVSLDPKLDFLSVMKRPLRPQLILLRPHT